MQRGLSSRAPVCAGVLALAGAGLARADVLVTNLAEPLRDTTPIGNNPNPVPAPFPSPEWYWAAQSFVTDGQSYALGQIDIIAGDENAAPVVVAELRADNAGAIGTLITTLVAPSFVGSQSPRTLVPASPVSLAPATIYWVVLGSQAPGDGTLGWSYANTNLSQGTGLIGLFADSTDSGGTWNYASASPYFIQVIAEPEPPQCVQCPGDVNGDDIVGFADITQILVNWGNCP